LVPDLELATDEPVHRVARGESGYDARSRLEVKHRSRERGVARERKRRADELELLNEIVGATAALANLHSERRHAVPLERRLRDERDDLVAGRHYRDVVI